MEGNEKGREGRKREDGLLPIKMYLWGKVEQKWQKVGIGSDFLSFPPSMTVAFKFSKVHF